MLPSISRRISGAALISPLISGTRSIKMSATVMPFDCAKYARLQEEAIHERLDRFQLNKLYIEFGGKLLFDMHASRVLPGFDPNIKVKLLQQMKDRLEVVLCIYAEEIDSSYSADFGISYHRACLKLINELRACGIRISTVVVTRYTGQESVIALRNSVEQLGVKMVLHKPIAGYPHDIDHIVSEKGYGSNPYIETTADIVVVTGIAAGSGKLGTCLSQLYHDNKANRKSMYAKFELFPIWNLPLDHPINIAYEAATADIGDFNAVDPFHTKETAINYNRDIDAFPLLQKLLHKITGDDGVYVSPTEMGMNMAGFAISTDQVKESAKDEVVRRYFRYLRDGDQAAVARVSELLCLPTIDVADPAEHRVVVSRSRSSKSEQMEGAAIQLPDGRVFCSDQRHHSLLTSTASAFSNALSALFSIEWGNSFEAVKETNIAVFQHNRLPFINDTINTTQVLVNVSQVLSVLAALVKSEKDIAANLKLLRPFEIHSTAAPSKEDEDAIRLFGGNLTCDSKILQ